MSPDKGNKYRDVLITAKRARQLQGGASPQVTSKSMKFSRVAQEELAAGKIDAGSVGYKIASEYKAEADIAADFAAQQRSLAVRETAAASDAADEDLDDDIDDEDVDDEDDDADDEAEDAEEEDPDDEEDAEEEDPDDEDLDDAEEDDEDADAEDDDLDDVDHKAEKA